MSARRRLRPHTTMSRLCPRAARSLGMASRAHGANACQLVGHTSGQVFFNTFPNNIMCFFLCLQLLIAIEVLFGGFGFPK